MSGNDDDHDCSPDCRVKKNVAAFTEARLHPKSCSMFAWTICERSFQGSPSPLILVLGYANVLKFLKTHASNVGGGMPIAVSRNKKR